MTISVFWRKFKIGPFLAKNGQNWPFLAKNARFGSFLPNATINCSNFCKRNIFFGLLKNDANFFGGKILKMDFLGFFWPKFVHFESNMLISAYFSQTLLQIVLIFAIETFFLVFWKMTQIFFGGKFSKLTFWAHFDQNLTILSQICSFRPISPKR